MPVYEFRCNDTGKRFEVRMRYAEYDPEKVQSPFTGSTNVERIIRGVRLVRSETSRWEAAVGGDSDALSDLDEADPQTLGRALDHFGRDLEGELGYEFKEVVGRLRDGETPDQIEQSLVSPVETTTQAGGESL